MKGRTQNRFLVLTTVILLLAVVLLLGDLSASAYADSSEIASFQIIGSFDTVSTRQMLHSINDLRANDAWYWNETDTEMVQLSNLTPLVYDYGLERVAMQRAAELAVLYSHDRPNGENCTSAFPAGFTYCGENIACGFGLDADSVFNAWAEEYVGYEGQGHRRNMLNSRYRSVGIGCFVSNGITYWAQEFSSTVSSAGEDPLSSPVTVEVDPEYTGGIRFSRTRFDLLPEQSVNLANLKIYIGDAPIVYNEEALIVADQSVATIANGYLVAQEEGETILSITLSGLTAEAPVYVGVPVLSLDLPIEITVPEGEIVYFSFTPEESGYYSFSSSGSYDTYGYLYDENYNSVYCSI